MPILCKNPLNESLAFMEEDAMKKVFISHSAHDKEIVSELIDL